MKVAITGHTQGIGLAIANHFSTHTVIGFSRSTGYDINQANDRARILNQITDCDMFVNNAYGDKDNSQLLLLIAVHDLWRDTNQTIVNISSRYAQSKSSVYRENKYLQDLYCARNEYTLPTIINLKPGLVNTDRVAHITGPRLTVDQVVSVLTTALTSEFKIHTVTFGK